MKKIIEQHSWKRVLGLFLAVVMLLGSVDMTAIAAEPYLPGRQDAGSAGATSDGGDTAGVLEGNDISVREDNSLGRIFGAAIAADGDVSMADETGNSVYAVKINGGEAEVSFQTFDDGALVIGIYEESGEKLLATGSTYVSAGDREAVVPIEGAETLPEYFYVKAFLADAQNFRPLCEVYETDDYTQKMQEFYAKTTADFDADQVLNLDEDTGNNFLVFSDSVKVIPRSGDATVNTVEECDEEKLVYKIGNPEENFTSLKAGDIFAYYYGDNQAVITKVVSLESSEADGKTVLTISGEEPDFEQIVAFIKVGADNPREDSGEAARAVSSVMGTDTVVMAAAPEEIGAPWSLPGVKFSEDIKDDITGDSTGNISLSISDIGGWTALRIFRDSEERISTAELEITYGAKINLTAEGTLAEKSWTLGNPTMPTNVPGVTVSCELALKLEVAASVNAEGSIAGSVGVHVTADGEVKNISRAPEFTVNKGAELSVKLGLVISPTVSFVHKKILSVAVNIDFGLKVTLAANAKLFDTASRRHACNLCFSVTMTPYLEISGEGVFLCGKAEISLLDIDLPGKIEAYFSPEYSPHFGWGECPHWIYDGDVRVLYFTGKPVADAKVISSVGEGMTDADGKVALRLNVGRQNLYVEKDGKLYSQSVDVPGELGRVTINIDSTKFQTLSDSTFVKEVYAASVSYTGLYASRGVAYAALTRDGSLYMWGDNCSRGLLGNGEMYGVQNTPVKVLLKEREGEEKKVKNFQFGPFYDGGIHEVYPICAAVTEDGSLYLWGADSLGGGPKTSPEKVQFPLGTKVDKVSFYMNPNGGINAAAITTNGDLYQWGSIGLDTYAKPRYIMSDVEEVFAAQDRATYAAITKTDRKLFLWGDNCDGLAGQPYSQYENLTHKVLPSDYQDKGLGAFMDSVQEVYLGYDIGAALRENGDLLMWGRGYSSYQFMEDNSDEKYWNPKQLILSDVSEFYWEYPDYPNKIFSDSMSCAAIKKDGTLYMWGKNEYGQLGTGDNTDVATPQPVAGVQDVKSFHMENGTCAAVTGDGKLYMWGRNEGGSVGNGKQEICSQPVQVLSDEEVNSFTFLADARLSAALTKDKALYMWGVYDGHEHQYDGFLSGTIYTPELKLEQADKLIPYPTYYYDRGGTSFTDAVMYTKFACVKTDGTLYESVRSKNDGYFLEDLDEAVADSVCKVSYTGGNSYYASYYDNVIARGKKGSVYTWKEASAASEPPAIKRVYFFGGAEIIKPLPEEKTQASLMAVPAKISLRGSDPEASSDGGDSGNASRTEAFTGLRPNEIYNVYAMKSRAAKQPLASDNLLYIGQYVSDADGSLQADFEMKESCAEPDIFCVGMSRTDIAETEVEVPDILYDGSEHMPEVTVKYNGQTLTQGTDYKVYFKEYAKEIGEYELTVAGIGLYRGEKTVTFRVIEKGDDGDVSGGDISGGDVSGGDTPNETSDGGDKPGGDVSDGDVSGGDISGDDISGGDTPGGDNPPPKPDYGDVLPQDVPKDGVIPEDLWIAGVEEGYGYTGSAIRPKVRVYDGKTRLTEKKDYIIAYKNNVKANDASVAGKAPTITVTGKGNYTGRDTRTFQILPLDIGSESEGNLFEADDIAIAGSSKAQKPVPELYWNGRKLKNRADYTVTYHKGTYSGAETEALPSVKEPGSYYVKLTGNTNFTGVRRVQLTVLPEGAVKPIAKAKAVKIPNQPYRIGNQDGAVTPEVVVKDGSRTLTRDVHYTVTYSNNKKVGTAYAIIRGIEANGYCGTKRVPFKITGIALKKASVTGLAGQTFVYDGTAKEPQLTLSVKVNGTAVPLVKDRDYSVRWQNNVNAGTAAVIFTGKNGYTGTLKKTFKIKAFNLAEDRDGRFRVEMEAASTPYAKGGARPGLTVTFRQADGTVRTLKEGTDYTVTCKNNRAVNDGSKGSLPTLTIRGKGNFSDVCPESLTYRITAQDISRLTLSAADKVYQNRGNIYPTKVTITDLDGKVLKAGTDYDRNLTYTYKNDTTLGDGTVRAAGTAVAKTDVIPAGTVICVAAAPKGNYTGTPLTGEYSIKTYSIAGAKVTIPAQTYTGRAITLDKADESQILVRVGGRKVDAGQFEIVRYNNRVNKGTATVTIRGIGNYGGEKTVKFKIKAKGFRWWWNR